jgi:hypothetical protein
MDRGSARSSSHLEVAPELTRAGFYSPDAKAFAQYPFHPAAVIGHYQVQPAIDPPQIDRDLRCGRVTLDIGHGLLGYAKERPLHLGWQLIDHRACSKLDAES